MLRGHSNVRLIKRPMGLYEGTSEVLASSNHHRIITAGDVGGLCAGISYRSIYLHIILRKI